MFIWSDESILWYQAAAEWTKYHLLVSKEIEEFFHADDYVCDVGCGLGCMSIILAPLVKHITAVDIEPRVLKILNDRAKEEGIVNISPVESDWKLLNDNSYDTVLACSFGTLQKDFYDFMRLARKRLIIIKRGHTKERNGFATEYSRTYGANNDEEFLDRNRIPYQIKTFQADFGQPLREKGEAVRFVEHYRLRPEDQSMDDYLAQHMIEEPDGVYQYYLPNMKNVHILVIEKADAGI